MTSLLPHLLRRGAVLLGALALTGCSSSTTLEAAPTGTVVVPGQTTTAVGATTLPASTVALAPPTTATPVPAVGATSFAVFDTSSQQMMASGAPDAQVPVGSLIKLLTAYVAMQAGEPSRVVTVPDLQLDPMESAIGLYPGEQLPRDVLIRAMLIVSANDAARVLAIDVAGSELSFVQKMNDAAAALGLSGTVALNPVGLDAAGQYSTARDMVVLGNALMADPTFRATAARTDARLHGAVWPATNDLLRLYAGADGIKTGHTTQAGYCILASATRDGRTIIVAVLGAATEQARYDAASTLLDWAFAN